MRRREGESLGQQSNARKKRDGGDQKLNVGRGADVAAGKEGDDALMIVRIGVRVDEGVQCGSYCGGGNE